MNTTTTTTHADVVANPERYAEEIKQVIEEVLETSGGHMEIERYSMTTVLMHYTTLNPFVSYNTEFRTNTAAYDLNDERAKFEAFLIAYSE